MKRGAGKLALELTLSQKKVKSFLEAKYRKHKSQSTVKKYGFALGQFQTFLNQEYPDHTIETILPLLSKKEIPVYTLLNDFVAYLEEQEISAKSVCDYMTGVRSFLLFESEYEIDISRFKDRVALPSPDTEHEQAIDANTIRKILNSCNNRRLKAFLYLLATSGVRAMEGISLRLKDIELSEVKGEPSIIYVRKEYSKTRRPRTILITPEASEYLSQWIEYKYSEKPKNIIEDGKRKVKLVRLERKEDHIIFGVLEESDLSNIYKKLRRGFNDILKTLDLDDRKDGMLRRRVTFHSFRRFVKTTITDNKSEAFANFMLGHKRDMGYYTKTLEAKIKDYKEVVPFLTFTDYSALEAEDKSMKSQMEAQREEILDLKKRDAELKELTLLMGSEFVKSLAELKKHNLLKMEPLTPAQQERLNDIKQRLQKLEVKKE